MIFVYIIFAAIVLAVVAYLFYVIVIWMIVKVPYVKSKQDRLEIILSKLDLENKVVYELGCGTADFLFLAEKNNPKKLVGIELSPLLYIIAKLKKIFKRSQVEIRCQNFFKADLKDADIIYMFLVPSVVNQAWQKISQECRPNTQVIVLADSIKGKEPVEKIALPNSSTKIYFYKL